MKLWKLIKFCLTKKHCVVCQKKTGKHLLLHINDKYGKLLEKLAKFESFSKKKVKNWSNRSRILNKYLDQVLRTVKDRLPIGGIFQCRKCSFSSNSLGNFKDHFSSHERSGSSSVSVSSLEQNGALVKETKTQLHFHKSRCKDALGLLERAPNPDDFHLIDFRSMVRENHRCVRADLPPKSLSHLAGRVAPSITLPSRSHNASLFFHDTNRPPIWRKDWLPKFTEGFCCSVCSEVFTSYANFDDHLDPESGCGGSIPDPIKFCLNAESNIPIEYNVGCRYPKFLLSDKLASKNWLSCRSCEKSDFDTIGKFHEHLLRCSRETFMADLLRKSQSKQGTDTHVVVDTSPDDKQGLTENVQVNGFGESDENDFDLEL